MSGQLDRVGQHRVVADHAIVRDMNVGHDPVVRADPGRAATLHGSQVQRAKLPDRIAVADLQLGRLAPVFLVLRYFTERAEWKDPIVASDPSAPHDHHVGVNRRARPDRDFRPDHAKWPDLDALGQLGARVDQGAGVDSRHYYSRTARVDGVTCSCRSGRARRPSCALIDRRTSGRPGRRPGPVRPPWP